MKVARKPSIGCLRRRPGVVWLTRVVSCQHTIRYELASRGAPIATRLSGWQSHHRTDLVGDSQQCLAEDLVAHQRVEAGMPCAGVRVAPILLQRTGFGEGCCAVDVQQD